MTKKLFSSGPVSLHKFWYGYTDRPAFAILIETETGFDEEYFPSFDNPLVVDQVLARFQELRAALKEI